VNTNKAHQELNNPKGDEKMKIVLEMNGYRAEFDKNEKAAEKAKKLFDEDIQEMGFNDIHELVSYVYALRQYADDFLEIVMVTLPLEEDEGEEGE
jgi:hypothetical protein